MMSERTDRITSALDAERDPRTVDAPREALRALGDEKACRLLRALGLPKTVAQLSDELGMPQSTAYRKIGKLEDLALVQSENPSRARNVPARYYRSYREIGVRLEPNVQVELR